VVHALRSRLYFRVAHQWEGRGNRFVGEGSPRSVLRRRNFRRI